MTWISSVNRTRTQSPGSNPPAGESMVVTTQSSAVTGPEYSRVRDRAVLGSKLVVAPSTSTSARIGPPTPPSRRAMEMDPGFPPGGRRGSKVSPLCATTTTRPSEISADSTSSGRETFSENTDSNSGLGVVWPLNGAQAGHRPPRVSWKVTGSV